MTDTASRVKHVKRKFAVDVPFVKSATDSGDLELTGYASTWVQDRDGDYVDPKAFDEDLDAYLRKNPILLYQHSMKMPLGTVDEAKTDGTGLFVRCTIPEPMEGEEAWRKTAYVGCKSGTLRTFSIGGYFHFDIENLGESDEKWIIKRVELMEISVVSIPSNPDSIFESAVKALDDERDPVGHVMSEQAFGQLLDLLGIEEAGDKTLADLDESGRERRYEELAALFLRVKGRKAPAYDAYRAIIKDLGPAPTLAEELAALPEVNALVANLYEPAAHTRCLSCGAEQGGEE